MEIAARTLTNSGGNFKKRNTLGLKIPILITLLLFLISFSNAYALTVWATASSQIAGWEAENVNDYNPTTCWSSQIHATSDNTEWIQLNADENVVISEITLVPRMHNGNSLAFPQDFYIEYSYDEAGNYWFPVPGQFYQSYTSPTGNVVLTLDGTIVTRGLRITATKLSPDDSGVNYFFQLADFYCTLSTEILPFETSQGGDVDARLNMMWKMFGNMSDGSYYRDDTYPPQPDDPWDSHPTDGCTYDFGNEPAYYDRMALKYAWSKTTEDRLNGLKNVRIAPMAQSSDGYIWSWITQETWPVMEQPYHQDNNAKYILACWRCWTWDRNDSFFDSIDTTVINTPTAPSRTDISQNMTIREKLRLAMQYLEYELSGQLGGIIIEDTDLDGDTYMDNDGTRATGIPTNYWDNYHYGYKNAYDNIFYYGALEAMAQLEILWGNPDRAAQLRTYRDGCKTDYDNTFWDATKGRYIACVDADDNSHDFGMTFQNLEALAYGLGDYSKAVSILEWLDGTRTIAGDTSQGSDIYYWGFAPRSNTLDVASTGTPYWWADANGQIDITPVTGNSRYGLHLENGGSIFYTSFFDLVIRAAYQGPDDAYDRLMDILDEFQIDQLRRDPYTDVYPAWQIGIMGEFPESGLVPCAIVYGFAGLFPDNAGLHISPKLPTEWTYLKVNQITYAGALLNIEVTPTNVTITSDITSSNTLYVGSTAVAPGQTQVFDNTMGLEEVLLSPWATLTYDDFESGWGNYTDGGGDCQRISTPYSHQGSYSADIQDNSGTASSFYHTSGIDVATDGYTQIKVEFWFQPVSMDKTTEDFWVQYYDGSNWHTVASYAKGIDFENNNFYFRTVIIDEANYYFPADMKIRFMCDASGNADDVYIDEIKVSAK